MRCAIRRNRTFRAKPPLRFTKSHSVTLSPQVNVGNNVTKVNNVATFLFTRKDGGSSILLGSLWREGAREEESLAPLIEFIGKKFDQVDQRFEGIDRRLDQVATKEELGSQLAETRRHFEVVAERMQSQVRLVAEGVAEMSQRLDRRTAEITAKIEQESAETRAMIRFSYVQIERRIQELEGNYASLSERVERLESSRV